MMERKKKARVDEDTGQNADIVAGKYTSASWQTKYKNLQ